MVVAMLHERRRFFGSEDAEASFSKNLGSEASRKRLLYIYFFCIYIKKNIQNTKLIVEDMEACIFVHKSR